MAVVGCYELHLYCDTGDTDGGAYGTKCPNAGFREYPHEYTGMSESECIRKAREQGWKFNRDRTKAYCPQCSNKR